MRKNQHNQEDDSNDSIEKRRATETFVQFKRWPLVWDGASSKKLSQLTRTKPKYDFITKLEQNLRIFLQKRAKPKLHFLGIILLVSNATAGWLRC